MILNPMYKTAGTADYTKRYCISTSMFGGTSPQSIAPYGMIYQDGDLDIYLDKEFFKNALPPCNRLTCASYFIQGTLRGKGLSIVGDDVPVNFTVNTFGSGNVGKVYLSLMYDQAYGQGYEFGIKFYGGAEVDKTSDMISIGIENYDDVMGFEDGAIHIHVKLPISSVTGFDKNFKLVNESSGALNGWYTRLESVLLNVKCFNDA